MTSHNMTALWAEYEPRRVRGKKSEAEYVRLFKAHIEPRLGKRPLSKVTFQDIDKIHDDLRETPYQANRVLALLKVLFKYAIALQWLPPGYNPAKDVRMYTERKRRRHMKPKEAPRIAQAIAMHERGNIDACLFLWLIIFTGARSGEIRDARWCDLDGNVLTLRNHKTQEKTGVDRVIVLPEAAIAKLNFLRPEVHGRDPDEKIIRISRPEVLWQRIIRVEAECQDLRVHDLRHTFGTYALEKGYTLDQIGEALNHSSPTTTKIYAELSSRSRKHLAEAVSLGILADMGVANSHDVYGTND